MGILFSISSYFNVLPEDGHLCSISWGENRGTKWAGFRTLNHMWHKQLWLFEVRTAMAKEL